MLHWLRRLFSRPSAPGRPPVGNREAAWLVRSAVPTEADEVARRRALERSDHAGPEAE